MPLTAARHIPSSTYRMQLSARFTFRQLEERLPYLGALGIGDCYCSPIFFSPPGSTHGYDVSDYRRIDPELGGEPAFGRLAEKLRAAGLGLVLDFVPNHMGINGPFNPWWLEVLECGRRSPYAHFFDVDWKAREGSKNARILVPVLDDRYGIVLENGGLALKCEHGAFRVYFGDAYFPLRPSTAAEILDGLAGDPACPSPVTEEVNEIAGALRRADPPESDVGSHPDAQLSGRLAALKKRLAGIWARDESACQLLAGRLRELNGRAGVSASFDQLDRILDNQHYRLAHWKTGVYAVNYRRFFAIDSLIGMRMEEPDVFKECHERVARLLREGQITGLRIDHIDGLWDPQQYLERLQSLAPPPPGTTGATYVLVEKILEGNEELPSSWPTQGTTGYEFIAQCARLYVLASGERELTDSYHAFAGPQPPFAEVAYEKKRLVLSEMFANTVTLLADRLAEILNGDRRQRDLTHRELVVAIRETMAALPVYRTYRRAEGGLSDQDAAAMETACVRAIRQNPRFDPGVFRLVHDIVAGIYPSADAPEAYRRRLIRWVFGFQQYTGAIMAKAMEDTAFYAYNRLIALNEVGGDPGIFGGGVADFHAANLRRSEQTPQALLASSTHDTKLSEDARARLYVLSEIPREWDAWLREWREINQRHKRSVEGQPVPDANEEYRLYQVLLGAWPLAEDGATDAFRARIRDHVRKSVNEAKLNTTWTQPNDAWLDAGDHFIDAILSVSSGGAFLESFRAKAARLAHLGMVNSLSQLVLKTMSPGVPDFYQGNETWEFRLVDPDNRQPVDFASRESLLAAGEARLPRDLLEAWRDGAIKLFVTRRLLRLRRNRRELFAFGSYVPLTVRGRFSDRIVAFLRVHRGVAVLAAAPRHTATLGCPPLGPVWEDTAIVLPSAEASWKELLTGRMLGSRSEILVSELFVDLPFGVCAPADF